MGVFRNIAIAAGAVIAGTAAYYGSTKTSHNHDGGNSDNSYVTVAATYCPSAQVSADGHCTYGDGSTAQGGRAAAYAKQPPIVPSNFPTDAWLGSKTSTPILGGEAKFRTHCNHSHHSYEDPIVFPKQRGVSHLHTFFGNDKMGADSTYESLRTTGGSTCGGGKINRSGYWYPALLKDNALGDGKTMVIKPAHAVVYYNVPQSRVAEFSPLARNLQYVFGFNLSDPAEVAHKAEVAATAGYTWRDNGFAGWRCSDSGTYYPYLRDETGAATFTCAAGNSIIATLFAPGCWDGTNLTSSNGRKHFRTYVQHNATGNVRICPEGWYRIATFELILVFDNPTGSSDYKEWYLSADRMANDWTGGDCFGDGNGYAFCNGQTMHADWFGAWDYEIMRTWMLKCNGTTIPTGPDNPDGTAPDMHECGSTQFGDGRRGIGFSNENAPDGTRNPQLNLTTPRWDATTRFDPMPGAL